jgi:hypothetical protein
MTQVNLILIRQGITADVTGFGVAVITLFATSAIGFLISQFWFAFFHNKDISPVTLKGTKQILAPLNTI